MRRTLYFIVVLPLTLILVSGCGRRLPDEPINSVASNPPTESSVTEESEVEAEATEESEAATEEPEVEAEATEESEEADAEAVEAEAESEESDAEAVEAEEAGEEDLVAQAIATGDPANGQVIFNQSYDTAVGPWICASCHSVTEDGQRLVGPGLYGIYDHTPERIAETGDADGVEYIRNSILHPQDYIVLGDPPYPENLMPPNYEELLSEQELNDVIAYLLSLDT